MRWWRPACWSVTTSSRSCGAAVDGLHRGEGAVVLVSGEAGVGKSSLVKAFLRTLDKRVRVPVGSVRGPPEPAHLGPAARRRPRAGLTARRRARAGDQDAVFAAVHEELSDRGSRPCWWSRTSTGPTTPPSTSCVSSAGGIATLPAVLLVDLPRRRVQPRAVAAPPARRPQRGRGAADRAARLSPDAVARMAGGHARPPTCTGSRRATRSSSPRCSAARTAGCPPRSPTPCSPACAGSRPPRSGAVEQLAVVPGALRAVAGAGGARGHRRPRRGRAGAGADGARRRGRVPARAGAPRRGGRAAGAGARWRSTRRCSRRCSPARIPTSTGSCTTRCRRAPTTRSSSTRRRRRGGPARRARRTRAPTCTGASSTAASCSAPSGAALGQAHAWALFHADRRARRRAGRRARGPDPRASSASPGRWGGRWRSWPCSTRPTTGWGRRGSRPSGRRRCSPRSATPPRTPRRWCFLAILFTVVDREREGLRARRRRARDGRARRRRPRCAPMALLFHGRAAMELGDPGGLDEVLREHGRSAAVGRHHRRRDDGLPQPGPPAVARRPVRRGRPAPRRLGRPSRARPGVPTHDHTRASYRLRAAGDAGRLGGRRGGPARDRRQR